MPFGPILASTSWASIQGVKSNAEGSASNSNVNGHASDRGEKSSMPISQENPKSPSPTLTIPPEAPPSERASDLQNVSGSDGSPSVTDESIDAGTTVGKPATEPKVEESRQQAPTASNQSQTQEFLFSEERAIENWSASAEQVDPPSTTPTAPAAGAAFASAIASTVEGITELGNLALNGNAANSSAIASNGNASQQAIKSPQSKNSGMVLSADSKSTTLAEPAKGNLSPGCGASSNGAQANSEGSQHAEAGSTATLATSTAATNSAGFAATSTLIAHSIPHQTSFHDPVRNDNGGTSLPAEASGRSSSEQLNSGMTTGPGGINTARLIQSMSESELCVGMHSVEFGEISVRTSVSQQQMLAQISTEHADLGVAISGHIPSMQEKLGNEYGLHASIEVNQGGASFSDGRGQSSQREQRTSVLTLERVNSLAPAEIERVAGRVSPMIGDGYRLDIRA